MKKFTIGLVIIIGLVALKIFIPQPQGLKANLVNPISWTDNPAPSAAPMSPSAPKTYLFDGATDLRKELESINPQVLDSDFAGQ